MKTVPPYPLSEECARPDRAARLAGRALRAAWHGTHSERGRFFTALRDSVHLVGRELFGVDEIARLGLLQPQVSLAGPRKVTSRAAMTRIEEALNPAAWRMQVANKAVFYRTCAALGIPTPRLLGVFFPDRVGWWQGGPVTADGNRWKERFQRECPEEFVIKPAVGAYGEGVSVISRDGPEDFLTAAGRKLTPDELFCELARVGANHGCVIQERAWNHPEVERLSGSRYLQTARLITMLDGQGDAHIIHGHLKIIRGRNCIDNYHYGATGNFIAQIERVDGRLHAGATADRERGGFLRLERHPETNVAVTGFQVPLWEEACRLGCTLARAFAPLRFVGWDIAITPAGPVAMEGNWNADPPNHNLCLDRILADVRRLW